MVRTLYAEHPFKIDNEPTREISVIITNDFRGLGKREDPYRRVVQLWTKDGELIVEFDPLNHRARDHARLDWLDEHHGEKRDGLCLHTVGVKVGRETARGAIDREMDS